MFSSWSTRSSVRLFSVRLQSLFLCFFVPPQLISAIIGERASELGYVFRCRAREVAVQARGLLFDFIVFLNDCAVSPRNIKLMPLNRVWKVLLAKHNIHFPLQSTLWNYLVTLPCDTNGLDWGTWYVLSSLHNKYLQRYTIVTIVNTLTANISVVRVNLKLSLSLTKLHHEGVLGSGGEWSVSRPGLFTPEGSSPLTH